MHAPTASPALFASLTDDVVASGSETDRRPHARRPARRCTSCPARAPTTCATRSPAPGSRSSRGRVPGSPSAAACCCAAHDLLLEPRRAAARPRAARERQDPRPGASRSSTRRPSVDAVQRPRRRKRVLRGAPPSGRRAARHRTTRVRYRPKGVVGVITPVELRARASPRWTSSPPSRPAARSCRRPTTRARSRSSRCAARSSTPACPRRCGRSSPVPPHEVGEALTDEVDYICFTGSTATGRQDRREGRPAPRRRVARARRQERDDRARRRRPRAGRRGCRVRLLLGDGPAVRLDRAHLRRPEGRRRRSRRALVERLRVGHARRRRSTTAADFGSLASAAQLERIEGAPRRRGREGRDGARRRPRTDPTSVPGSSSRRCSPASRRDMRAYAEETFGAIASLYLVDSDEEAILAANASEYGLNASVLHAFAGAAAGASPTRSRPAASTSTRATAAPSASVDAPDGRREGSRASVGATDPRACCASSIPSRSCRRRPGSCQLPRTGRGVRRDGRCRSCCSRGRCGRSGALGACRDPDRRRPIGSRERSAPARAQVASESNGAGSPAPSASRLRLRCR